MLVTSGSCSGCTACITLHDSHRASFDYRRQRKGGQRQIWWPCSSGASMAVSRTSDGASVYGSQHNEWSKVWFKWARPDPSNCSPLSVITTFVCALCFGRHTGSRQLHQDCCLSIVPFLFDFSLLGLQSVKTHLLMWELFSVSGHIWEVAKVEVIYGDGQEKITQQVMSVSDTTEDFLLQTWFCFVRPTIRIYVF